MAPLLGLTTTAHSEYQIATQSNNRPSTSTFTASSGLSQLIPPLLTAIENENTFPEDAFQAQVCLGWLHWVLAEPGLAISRLPANFGLSIEGLSGQATTLAGWTQVCLVKGAYVRGQIPPFRLGTYVGHCLTISRRVSREDWKLP